jgi:transcriptional regulator with XRE-family HTH domain
MGWGDKVTLAERLLVLRREAGMTQAQVGDALGISARVYGYYEAGDRLPKEAETYIKIADLYNCSLDWLFGRSLIKGFDDDGADSVKVDKTVLRSVLSSLQQGIDTLGAFLPIQKENNPDESEQE